MNRIAHDGSYGGLALTLQTLGELETVRAHVTDILLAHDLRWQLVSTLAHGDRRAQELAALLGQPANLISYHLHRLRQASLVRQRASSADHRAQYYSLDLPHVQALFAQAGQALHPALGAAQAAPRTEAEARPAAPDRPSARVLFLCTHDSARSQMAELKKRTLTNLYNQRPTWLDNAHRRLDEAVFAAYRWPADLSDDETRSVARLLALNLERAAAQGALA